MTSDTRIAALRETITSVTAERGRLAVRAQQLELKHERLAVSLAQDLCPVKRKQRFRVIGLVDAKATEARTYLRNGKLYDFNDQPLLSSSIYEVERVKAFGQGLEDVAQYGYCITARRVLRSGRLSSERYAITPAFTLERVTKANVKRLAARSAPIHCGSARGTRKSSDAVTGAAWDHERAGLS